jgi:hypothetical protein
VPDPNAFLVAYVGLGPGQEFIPQFLALLIMAGTALLAVVQWPFVALLRRLRRSNDHPAGAAEKQSDEPGDNP